MLETSAHSAQDPDRDIDAWREALVAAIPTLRAFAWSLARSSADAEDLVQDTLIKALSNPDKFRPGTNLRAWLFTILRNTFYTASVRRAREMPDPDGEQAGRLSVEADQEWAAQFADVRQALADLPDEHREAVVLVGAAGFTYEEAAEVTGCALGTIKSRVHRARARLISALGV